jgi:hypothetical protein
MHAYMSPHVDVISRGNLTQGYDCLDFSLKITKGLGGSCFPVPTPKKRKKRGSRSKSSQPDRTAVPGAYRCVKEPVAACERLVLVLRPWRSAAFSKGPSCAS